MDDATRGRLVDMGNGAFIEEDVLGIIQRIKEYDPNLSVQCLTGRADSPSDTPYRVMEMCPDGILRMVFGVWELDERVLQRLAAADNQRGNVLARIESNNVQVRERQQRRFREEVLGAAGEITKAVIKSNKTEYSIPGQNPGEVVVIHSHQPSKIVQAKPK